MTYVIKLSKPGFNVNTATDKQLALSSELNHLKTSTSSSFQKTGDGTQTVAHGLGYQPLVICYFRDTVTNNTRWYISMSGAPSVSPARFSAPCNVSVYVDATNVYLNVTGNAGTIDVKYEIFYEGDA